MAEETLTIGANSQQAVDIKGRFFAVLGCTAPFQIEVDRGGKRTCSQGVRFSFESFKRIMFFETQGAANTITYYAGDAQYDGTIPRVDDAVPVIAAAGIPFQVIDADTFDYPYIMANDGSLTLISHASPLNAGTAQALPAQIVIAGKTYQRKSFHIANRTNDDLAIYKSTNECIDILNGNDNRTFSFSFDVLIQFLSGGGSNKIALYYTLFSTPVS